MDCDLERDEPLFDKQLPVRVDNGLGADASQTTTLTVRVLRGAKAS